MLPRPFPHALSVGTDICQTSRFLKYLVAGGTTSSSSTSTSPKTTAAATTATTPKVPTALFRLFDKVLLPSEQRGFWRRFPDLHLKMRRGDFAYRRVVAGWIGGRWAAKEAIIKAYSSSRPLTLRQIEIRADPRTRQPYGIVHDASASASTSLYLEPANEIYKALVERGDLRAVKEGAGDRGKSARAPRILSEDGVVDLGAVEMALKEGEEERVREKEEESGMEEDDVEGIEGQIVRVSISHDGEYCVATALAPVGA